MIGIKTGDIWWEIIEELNRDLPNNEVVKAIYNHEVTRDAIDYLELVKVDDEAQLSFLPKSKLETVLRKGEDAWTASSRQTSRIGKALNKILIYEVQNDHLKEMVEHVQKSFADSSYDIKFVQPKDFGYYYLIDNYIPAPNSELGKSCMRYDKCQPWLDFYADNPNLEMIVCTRRGRVAARALIWKNVRLANEDDFKPNTSYYSMHHNRTLIGCKQDGLTLLDRVYSVNPISKKMITDWGKENCDLVHSVPKVSTSFYVRELNRDESHLALIQPHDKYLYKGHPYVDTFYAFSKSKGILANTDTLTPMDGMLYRSTDGGFSRAGTESPMRNEILYELEHGTPPPPDFRTKQWKPIRAEFEVAEPDYHFDLDED